MPETKPRRWWTGVRERFRHGLGTKLIGLLLGAMVVIFSLLGYLNIRLHRKHLDAAALLSVERISDVIKRSTTYSMMRNDRDGLHNTMTTMANEPGVVKVRVFDREGRISYSTEPSEISHGVDKKAEACYGCHSQQQPLTKLNRPDRFRVYRSGGGARVLAIITPIENQPECSNAACHAHPESQQILGVLDTHMSLARADQQLAQGTWQMLAYDVLAMVAIAVLSWLFIRRMVDRPLKQLEEGTERLSEGELGYQIELQSQDQIGDLAASFNSMSLQLRAANEEIVAWARTLEDRVEQKSRDLKRAHDHMLHVEKMASIGKMAAVVAHEINNPLSGILTYAKLLRKWLDRGDAAGDKKQETLECLDLIASESQRCGELVKNLLTFSRTAPMNLELTNLNAVMDRSIRLVQHQLEMNTIQLQLELAEGLPLVQCDPAQIEQVVLALVMNAIDAMPRGGNLWLKTRLTDDRSSIQIEIRDDGTGIPLELLPRMFEPFLSTKERGRGVGLGLAISHSIVERHNGRIEVESELGKGTKFTVTLPLAAVDAFPVGTGNAASGTKAR
ncbi:MAG: HAMP domain-containing protein [Acidobacteriales bacterium]|nr:HAMP domain-containing protein [Terriglobales bacterium]